MKIDFDSEANALMIQFREGKSEQTRELDEDTIIDLDKKGILAIELLDVVPKISLESLSNVKSRMLRKEFKELRSRLPTLWTRSYFVSTHGHISDKLIQKYIEEQKGM